jgi:cobalt/nickel transport system permease protein
MHIPDGFIDVGVSAGGGIVAAGGIGVCLRKAARTLEEKQAPLAGLVAAFIFAVQLLNFPVAAGTSGHLLGGTLAAVLVGPWTGAVCVALVLVVQALFFADGGLSALGLNVLNMALVTTFGGYLIFTGVRAVLRRSKGSVAAASAAGAFVSVVLAAGFFVVEYALGGTGNAPVPAVAAAMLGVHTLIGIGEAVITSITVGAVVAVRPDLVYGAKDLLPRLELRTVEQVANGSR